jgi:hypothetical protein
MKSKLIFSALCCCLSFLCFNSNAQWTQKAFFGGGSRFNATGFSIGTKGYLGTGWDDGLFSWEDFWEYDPSLNSWTQKTDFPGIFRFGAAGFSIGSKGYIGMGDDLFLGPFNDFWEYDPSTTGWTQKTSFGGIGLTVPVSFSIGTKGYVGTGIKGNNFTNEFWEYDPATNAWTQKANFGGQARGSAAGFSIGTKGYIGTGWDGGAGPGEKDFWEYDPSSNTWTQKANFDGPARSNATGFSIGTKGYIGLGFDGDNDFDDFWEYDPTTDTWIQKPYFGGEFRSDAVGFNIGTKGYVGTGIDWLGGFDDFWEFDPSVATRLTTGPISAGPYCTNSSVNVSFTSTATFNSGNMFVAQLSDANGAFFSNPTILGSIASTASSGNFNITIPAYTPAGSGYRIRIVSTNPAIKGIGNGADITIYQPDYIYITPNQIACDQVQLTVTGAQSGATYHWSSANNSILFNGTQTTLSTTSNPVYATGTSDYVVVNTTNTCGQPYGAGIMYSPFARVIDGLYPEYGSCGEHLSVSVNTTGYDTYYKWYVNSTLVKEGSGASGYCTCYYEGPDARVNGPNTITVEVQSYCGATEYGYGEFWFVCGSARTKPKSNVELYPNPAKGEVNIQIKNTIAVSGKGQINIEAKDPVDKSSGNNIKDIREVKIFDKLGMVKKVYKFPPNSKAVTINVISLHSDIYFVEVTDGKNKARLQLSVQK